jgi:hypothetical protein
MMQLIIASLALTLSVISLIWQAWTWRMSGPRLKVSCDHADDSIFIWNPDGPTRAQARHNKSQERWRNHCFIIVRNHGRAPTTIENVQMGNGNLGVDLSRYIVAERSDAPPPLRLDPSSTARWLVPLDAVEKGIRKELKLRAGDDIPLSRREIQARVTTGNGDVILCPLFPADTLWEHLADLGWLVISWPRIRRT